LNKELRKIERDFIVFTVRGQEIFSSFSSQLQRESYKKDKISDSITTSSTDDETNADASSLCYDERCIAHECKSIFH